MDLSNIEQGRVPQYTVGNCSDVFFIAATILGRMNTLPGGATLVFTVLPPPPSKWE